MDEAAAAIRANLTSYRDFEGFLEQQQMPLLVLNIRRNRLVQDSLQQVRRRSSRSEPRQLEELTPTFEIQIFTNRENLRKSLRIKFEGEEGIDAGRSLSVSTDVDIC
jgi:hypothetical protein